MNFKRNNLKSAIFKKFLFSYVVILLIPLFLATFAYNAATSVIEENAFDSNLTMLNQTRDIVDKHLKEIEEMMIQITFDSKMIGLLNISDPEEGSPEIYKLWEYARDIKTRTVTTNVFKSTFYIFLKNSNFIFSHDDTYYGLEKFYNNVLTYNGMSVDEYRGTLFDEYNYKKFIPSHDVTINGNNTSAITYLSSLPLVNGSKPQGAVVFIIDEQEIMKMLSNQVLKNSGSVVITDKSGTIISKSTNSKYGEGITDYIVHGKEGYTHKDINGVDTLLIYTNSGYSGLSYTAAIPKIEITKKVQYIREIAILVALISFVLGLVISYFWAYTNSKPFKEVLFTLGDFFNNDSKIKMENNLSEYDYLKGGVSSLIRGNRDMQETLARQSSELKTVLIDRLLKGDFIDKSRMIAILEHAGMEINGKNFVVAVFKLNFKNRYLNTELLDELELIRVRVEEIIVRNIGDNGYLHFIAEEQAAVLLKFPNENPKAIFDFINNFYNHTKNEMFNDFHISMDCGIGEVYGSLFDVHFSFREALQAIEAIADTGSMEHVLRYADIKQDNTSYYYPMDLEMKLANLAKAGNWNDIESILDRVYYENYKNRKISKSLEKYLFNNMKATLIKLLGGIKSDTDMRHLDYSTDNNNAAGMFDSIKNIYYKICMSIDEKRKSHNTQLTNKIVNFIEDNFTDANLSINSIATEFSLSESYFSQFFKEQTGEYFSNYLENLRINLACELIKEGSLSIDSIALKTGYNSSNSFRRAFKRVTGTSPSQYNS